MKKKILFLFAHLHKGGMQRAVSNITQALGDEYKLHIAYFGTENPDYKYCATMHNLNMSGSLNNNFFNKLKKYSQKLHILKDFIEENKFDTVVSFGESASLLNLISKHNSKKILSIRVDIDQGLGRGFYAAVSKILIKYYYRKSDLIVAVSKKLKQDSEKLVKNKIPVVYIPNMYPIDDIRRKSDEKLPKEFLFLKNEKYIINVGSLCNQKGQDLLINAYANLTKLNSEYKLVLVGRGPDKEKLINLTKKLNVNDKVIFIDFQSNPYVFIKNASLFVLSSRFEGFPNVLMESMICGKAVVSFNCPTGPNEIIDDFKNGRLVHDISVDSLENIMREVLTDSLIIKQYERNSLKKGKEYSFEDIAKKWRYIFDN